MSAREWKPGDVALGRKERANTWHHVIRTVDDTWTCSASSNCKPAEVRPIAVIDPEDREQVERLATAYLNAEYGSLDLREALREFADPTPRPKEPQGLGAVVEDAEGRTWVRVHELPVAWASGFIRNRRRYDDIDAIRVLSTGVEPLAQWERELLDEEDL